MPVAQGLSQGSSIRKGCASHQQTRVPGRLTCSRRSPSSRLSLNARTQSPAPQQFARSARSCRRQLKQHKKDCSCPSFSVCGCRQTTVCGAGTAHPEEVSTHSLASVSLICIELQLFCVCGCISLCELWFLKHFLALYMLAMVLLSCSLYAYRNEQDRAVMTASAAMSASPPLVWRRALGHSVVLLWNAQS